MRVDEGRVRRRRVRRAWSIGDFRAFERATCPERLRLFAAFEDGAPVWARSGTLRAKKETPGAYVDGCGE